MSTIKVNNLSGKGGATPNLPDGAVISGVATVTNLKPTNVNVSGAVTATTFDGSLKSTGTPTLGLGVTINSSGLVVSGVTTAGIGSFTTVYGDGSNLTGVGGSIGVWYYNPDVSDTDLNTGASDTGIGLTFSTKVVAGSGTATMKIVNAGVAGTTIQSWGLSSCTFDVQKLTFGTLVSDLVSAQTYEFSIPEGFIKDSGGTEYVGTAWTFTSRSQESAKLWIWGTNTEGALGLNQPTPSWKSSPTQIGSLDTWVDLMDGVGNPYGGGAINDDNELFVWGDNGNGECGNNTNLNISSPIQIPGSWGRSSNSTFGTREKYARAYDHTIAIKTDNTLWCWGDNTNGNLGQNSVVKYSSPVQVGSGADWKFASNGKGSAIAVKTDGTLWCWGNNDYGTIGQNQGGGPATEYSSPVQIPGTNWSTTKLNAGSATKTDGTLWTWGFNQYGNLGLNSAGNNAKRSSPTQVPGTTWVEAATVGTGGMGIKSDGTLWMWGYNGGGYRVLGQGNDTHYSSPVQVGSNTNWDKIATSNLYNFAAVYAGNTSGQLYSWGHGGFSALGQNSTSDIDGGPQIIGSDTTWDIIPIGG